MPSKEEIDGKRSAAIEKKEAERKAKNQEIMETKKQKQCERDKVKAAEQEKNSAAEKKKAAVEEKRKKSVDGIEAVRKANDGGAKKGGTKYSRKEVMQLKAIFDQYDKDRSGSITQKEFSEGLKSSKKQVRAGEKPTHADLQAASGSSILDMSDSVFIEMDRDGDGSVTMGELMRLMFPFAQEKELETMLEWVKPPPEPEPEPKAALSKEARDAILSLFKLHDKDKNGTMSKKEFNAAFGEGKLGLTKEDLEAMFKEFDIDEDKGLTKDEFLKLMESTGAYDDV